MTPEVFAAIAILPGATIAAAHGLDSPEARLLLMAVAGQESAWAARQQVPVAYAHGYWQEEIEAVQQAFDGRETGPIIRALCEGLDVPDDAATVFEAIVWCDPLAYLVARLTLLPDPEPLPVIGDEAAALAYYRRTWRPGSFAPSRWVGRYQAALAALGMTHQ